MLNLSLRHLPAAVNNRAFLALQFRYINSSGTVKPTSLLISDNRVLNFLITRQFYANGNLLLKNQLIKGKINKKDFVPFSTVSVYY